MNKSDKKVQQKYTLFKGFNQTIKKIDKQIKTTAKALSVSFLLMAGHNVYAQLGQNLSVDVRSLTLGNAVTADPPGISSIHFNPAGLTQIKGLQTDFQGLLVHFDIQREFSAPKDFNVFGYSDDPIVCNDKPNDGKKLCTDFKDFKVSKVKGLALYLPVINDFVELPAGLPLAAATFGAAYRPPGSKAVYASAIYAPLVAGFYHDNDDPAKYLGKRVAMERITYLSPSVGYEVDDHLSVGLSVGLSYQALALETDLRFPNDLIGVTRLIDEDVCAPFKQSQNLVTDLLLLGTCRAEEGLGPFKEIGSMQIVLEQTASPSFNVGVLWEPSDDLALGLVYQSPGQMNLKGKYKIKNAKPTRDLIQAMNTSITGQIVLALLNFPNNIPETESGLISMDLNYPAHFQAGIKYKVTPDLQVNFDVGYTDFDEWKNWTFNFERPISALSIARLLSSNATPKSLTLPVGFKSSWSWGVGIEQRLTDRLVTRLGYEPRNSAIPDDKRNTMVPINNAQLFAAGLGYEFDPDTTLDLAMMYLHSFDKIPANTSSIANKTGIDNLLINPYAGLDIKTKTNVFILGMAYRTRW